MHFFTSVAEIRNLTPTIDISDLVLETDVNGRKVNVTLDIPNSNTNLSSTSAFGFSAESTPDMRRASTSGILSVAHGGAVMIVIGPNDSLHFGIKT